MAIPELKGMLERFDAMPVVTGPDGTTYDMADPEDLAAVKAGWLRGGWDDAGLWPLHADPPMVLRRNWGDWFAGQYRTIINQHEVRHARHDAVDR